MSAAFEASKRYFTTYSQGETKKRGVSPSKGEKVNCPRNERNFTGNGAPGNRGNIQRASKRAREGGQVTCFMERARNFWHTEWERVRITITGRHLQRAEFTTELGGKPELERLSFHLSRPFLVIFPPRFFAREKNSTIGEKLMTLAVKLSFRKGEAQWAWKSSLRVHGDGTSGYFLPV